MKKFQGVCYTHKTNLYPSTIDVHFCCNEIAGKILSIASMRKENIVDLLTTTDSLFQRWASQVKKPYINIGVLCT